MSDAMVQVKFTIDSDTVSAFKARCASEVVSMASVICQFMKASQPAKVVKFGTDTRPQRKKAILAIIGMLDSIMQKDPTTGTISRNNSSRGGRRLIRLANS